MPRCYGCRSGFSAPVREQKFFSLMEVSFCSCKCLLNSIQSSTEADLQPFFDSGEIRAAMADDKPRESPSCYSPALGMAFRSGYEVVVAEFFVLTQKIRVLYEPFVLRFWDGKRFVRYLPDFYLPEYGIVIEVKGAWLNNGKFKYWKASEMLGAQRIWLFPPFYRKWFEAEIRGFHGTGFAKDQDDKEGRGFIGYGGIH